MIEIEVLWAVVLSGGRWFIGEASKTHYYAFKDGETELLTLSRAREMMSSIRPVESADGRHGLTRVVGVVPVAPAEKAITITVRPDALMQASEECPEELQRLLDEAKAAETAARSGLTIPKGVMQ